MAVIPEGELVYNRKGATPGTPTSAAKTDSEVLALLQRYKSELYASDPLVNLVGTWIWADVEAGDIMGRGARGLPLSRAWLEAEARAVSGKPNTPWTAPPVVQLSASTGVRAGEYILWTWSSTGATSCASVSEPGSFPVMPTSGFIYQLEPAPRTFSYTISCTGPYGTTYKTIPSITIAP